MNYDPTTQALVLDLLTALDAQAGDADLNYVDQLRRLQGVITQALATGGGDPSAEQDAAVMQALGRLDPHPDDAQTAYAERLRRLQGWVDVELSRWTSAPVQPPGPSGAAAVAEPQTIEPEA